VVALSLIFYMAVIYYDEIGGDASHFR